MHGATEKLMINNI